MDAQAGKRLTATKIRFKLQKVNILPFFKSHYSINKSILTLDKDHASNNGPKSIIKLAQDYGVSDPFLVDDNLSGFLEAYYNAKDANVKLNMGVRITVCDDMDKKDKESLKNESKYIIFLKKSKGYDTLFKIYSHASTKGLYYIPRIDMKTLESMWSDDLALGVPFYDSFLFKNHFTICNIIPPQFWCEPTFFIEQNGLPFDERFGESLKAYLDTAGLTAPLPCQSIFYEQKDDFLAYLTMRCIGKRTTLQKPNLDFMCSDQFCLESWEEKCKTN